MRDRNLMRTPWFGRMVRLEQGQQYNFSHRKLAYLSSKYSLRLNLKIDYISVVVSSGLVPASSFHYTWVFKNCICNITKFGQTSCWLLIFFWVFSITVFLSLCVKGHYRGCVSGAFHLPIGLFLPSRVLHPDPGFSLNAWITRSEFNITMKSVAIELCLVAIE